MRKLLNLLALATLALASLSACSNMPASGQSGQVEHPDPFHSYID